VSRQAKSAVLTVRRRSLLAGIVLVVLGSAGNASADTLSVSVSPSTVPAGQSVTLTVGGRDSHANASVDAFVGPASTPCAGDYGTEFNTNAVNGQAVLVNVGAGYGVVNGPYSFSHAVSTNLESQFSGDPAGDSFWGPPGQYAFCGYLYSFDTTTGTYTTYATGSAVVTLRAPQDAITVAPSFTTRAGGYFNIPIGYQVEAGTTSATLELAFYPKFYIEGGPYSCDYTPVTQLFNLSPGNGSVSFHVPVSPPGTYGMCATLTAGPLTLATASTTVIAAGGSSGAPSCVVPNVVGDTLARARKTLAHGRCKLGNVVRRKRHGRKRGTVLSQSIKAGGRRPAGTAINVVVAR
jgi:hypothetical protein